MTVRGQSFHLGHVANGRTSNSATLTLTVPAAGVRVGALLVAVGMSRAVSSIADTGGNTWTLVQADTTQTQQAQWCCLVTTALVSGNTITITFASKGDNSGGVEAFYGVQKIVEGAAKASGSLETEMPVTLSSLPSMCELIFVSRAVDEARTVSAASTDIRGDDGWTALTTFGATTGELAYSWYKFALPTSAHDHSLTQSSASGWNALIAAFRTVAPLASIGARGLVV